MSWDFSTDPDFQEQLDWMNEFVRREIWPLEAIWRELGPDCLREAIATLCAPRCSGAGWATAIHADPKPCGRRSRPCSAPIAAWRSRPTTSASRVGARWPSSS